MATFRWEWGDVVSSHLHKSRTVVTIEVLGLSDDYALAYYKSQEAAGSILPAEGAVLISLSDKVNLSEQAEIGKEL